MWDVLQRLRGALPAAFVAAGLVTAACNLGPPVAIRTVAIPTQGPAEDPTRCMAALVQGQLVASDRWGIALREPDGALRMVIWPAGYSGALTDRGLILRDASGLEVSGVGDWVEISGGEVEGGAWLACPSEPVMEWDRG